jgi:hypothetical protein
MGDNNGFIEPEVNDSSLVFILSLHRSGSTILYSLLAKTGCFNVITNYHILNYENLLNINQNHGEENAKAILGTLIKKRGITDRGIDRIQVTPDMPQEYGYLFLRKGFPPKTCLKNLRLLENLIEKVQQIDGKNKPLLLKNPYDFTNFIFLKKIYPNAKFVFIHRNPYDTLNSLMNAWRTILREKNNYSMFMPKKYEEFFNNPIALSLAQWFYTYPFSPGFFSEIFSTSRQTKYFLNNIGNLPSADFINITYETLVQSPNNTIQEILNFSDLKSNIDLGNSLNPRHQERIKEIKIFKRLIYLSMKSYFDFFNYSW